MNLQYFRTEVIFEMWYKLKLFQNYYKPEPKEWARSLVTSTRERNGMRHRPNHVCWS
jgi:hypothetical protein